MAFQWLRAMTTSVATLCVAASALLPAHAQAASQTETCKRQPGSAACKAQQAKKPAAKTSAAKSGTSTAKTASTAKSSAKSTSGKTATAAKTTKAPAKSVTKVSLKEAPARQASRKGAAKPASRQAPNADAVLAAVSASPHGDIASLRSSTAYVQDATTSDVLFAKNENVVRPIASISKLMTALVVVDANLPMDEMLEITEEDVDTLRHSASRLSVGTRLSRGDMLHLALMSSENRAAHALGRNYPGGLTAFVAAMNAKAQALGMHSTRFVEPTGLSSENVSSPQDLARMVIAASQQPLIHRYSTDTEYEVEINSRPLLFRNTNMLVRRDDWDIQVSKTGFIREAGECLVMMARIEGRDLAIVLLDSQGKLSRIGDAVRIRRILENQIAML